MTKFKFLEPQQHKFGSKEFFLQYISNQMKKEGKGLEVVHRVHFALTSLIFETHNGKEAMVMVKNLTEACEVISNSVRTSRFGVQNV